MPIQSCLKLKVAPNSSSMRSSYFGGNACLTTGQDMPTCLTCSSYMTHICRLDHSDLPFAGMMKSTGITSVFLCTSEECAGFPSFSRVDTVIIHSQGTENMKKNQLYEGQTVFPRHIISGISIEDSDDVVDKATYLKSDTDKTELVINISSLFNINFVSKKGRNVYLKNLILEDTASGLEIVGVNMAPTKTTKAPIKITIDEEEEDSTETVAKKPAAKKIVSKPEVPTSKPVAAKAEVATSKPVAAKSEVPTSKPVAAKSEVATSKTSTPTYSDMLKTPAVIVAPKPQVVVPKAEIATVEEKDEKKVETKKDEWVVVGKEEKEKKQKALLQKQEKIRKQLAYLAWEEKNKKNVEDEDEDEESE
jgi:hypothetical protein